MSTTDVPQTPKEMYIHNLMEFAFTYYADSPDYRFSITTHGELSSGVRHDVKGYAIEDIRIAVANKAEQPPAPIFSAENLRTDQLGQLHRLLHAVYEHAVASEKKSEAQTIMAVGMTGSAS